jgi:GT2 family glycosyltransferase
MKLSIIILNYHSLEVIKECLNSFEKYPPKVDYEIIIANNDDKKQEFNDFATHYPQIKFIQNTGNWGFSSGCNLGASIASGEYLLFLNPDTRLNETPAIDKMLEVFWKMIKILVFVVVGLSLITEFLKKNYY